MADKEKHAKAGRQLRAECACGAWLLVAVLAPLTASAIDLFPVATTGHDADIVYEVGLTAGATGANNELGSRQFYEQGISTQTASHKMGVPRSVTSFTSALTGDSISFDFQPFEQNNILKFTSGTAAKTLTLA